ncbi:MAG: outer membrane beta-barrel protein [Gammaproteobacteria bacterium]|nr:outer membrane beta-barrel protein [Gammaproteobacteria bacterium]MDE0260644.1 outer membrane beta-barrel protein [Gammaproteobacteria bacterium]
MDQHAILIVLGLFGAMASPTVTRVDLYAGANSSRFATEDPSIGVTAGVSATSSWGLRLGASYARRGYEDSACLDPPDLSLDPAEIPACFYSRRHFQRSQDYIDAQLLWMGDILSNDRLTLRLGGGGMLGFAAGCYETSLDNAPAQECRTRDEDFIAGVVAGTGLDIRMSRQWDLTLDLQYGHELTSASYRETEFGGYRMTSLLVGVAYRR